MDRNARDVLHQRRTRIGRQAKATQAVEFFNILTSPDLLEMTERLLPEHRGHIAAVHQYQKAAHLPSVTPECLYANTS